MEKKKINVAGDHSDTEEAVLFYLYRHPGWNSDTFSLVKEIKGNSEQTIEGRSQTQKNFEEMEYAVETLVMGKLVKGERQRAVSGDTYFSDLKLTPNGESAAIKASRRVRKLVIDIPRPESQ